ncbi:MAG: transcriptional regulator, LysR family [Rhodocyclaceae bacterium]|nr:transcriptional regulator, LysR family [Rhodocyclaceae bacterium]
MAKLNYKHLHYFWVVAQEGSVTRAAERLGVAVQTVSGQLSLLERSLGKALFAAQGRGLALTEAGRVALGYADRIFQLGEQMVDALDDAEGTRNLRLVAGISDGLPKLVAHRLLTSAMARLENMRLICHEGEFEDLLADLALHKLDVVLTDRPAPGSGNLRVFSHSLGELQVGLFATRSLAERFRDGFPASLNGAPLLLPTRHNMVRGQIDRWLEQHGIRPDLVGEFEDSALLQTFGRSGLGLFPAPLALAAEVRQELDAEPVGPLTGVGEQIYAISNERRIRHPAVEALRTSPLKAPEPGEFPAL